MYTDQEIVNKVWDVFITKQTPSSCGPKNGLMSCMYNESINGVGCGVGCLIDDNELKKKWDANSYSSIRTIKYNHSESYCKYFTEKQIDLLEYLQIWHDNYFRKEDLIKVIKQFNLQIPA